MTFEEALRERYNAWERRMAFKVNDETPTGILAAEYDLGYWDAVITVMKNQASGKLLTKI
jgi:predicted nucleic acid-binding protein